MFTLTSHFKIPNGNSNGMFNKETQAIFIKKKQNQKPKRNKIHDVR